MLLDRKGKINDYINRERYWTSNSVSQLNLSLQIVTGICIGFLTFAYKPDVLRELSSEFSKFNKSVLILSATFIFLSIISGLLAIISRLYDGRITRNNITSRRRYYAYEGKKLDDSTPKSLCLFLQTCMISRLLLNCCEPDTIQKEDVKPTKKFVRRFHRNRHIAHNLGLATWKYHKLQFLFLSLGIFLYLISSSVFCN